MRSLCRHRIAALLAGGLIAGGVMIGSSALAVEQIYLELPLKPICREDCRGLCTKCGCNRNRVECGCVDESIDPRLLALKSILNRS